jgi:aminopeptidase N
LSGDDLAKTEFEPSLKMSTYLVALVISDLSSTLENIGYYGKIDNRMCARSDAIENGLSDYAFEAARNILKYYEELFGIKYPLPKLGDFDDY